MKYMGSKSWMLENGLGHLLRDEAPRALRFIDLFAGSGAVANFVAEKTGRSVHAYDLQSFCVSLADTIVSRVRPLDHEGLWLMWERRATQRLNDLDCYHLATARIPNKDIFTRDFVFQARAQSSSHKELPITRSYGGHYFSHAQALWIDALRFTLPTDADEERLALAALIHAASRCAAAPGHTAQPFQPTRTAKRFLRESWARDVCAKTGDALRELAIRHASVAGKAQVADANVAVDEIQARDLVFIDPPYSGVHYSRFYHVLESIARGKCGEVFGVGRYPPPDERPRSKYSVASESREAISSLLEKVAEKGASAIVTFPDKLCSNGISSYLLQKIAREHFRNVQRTIVRGRFSTLGGDGDHRDARQPSSELVMILRA